MLNRFLMRSGLTIVKFIDMASQFFLNKRCGYKYRYTPASALDHPEELMLLVNKAILSFSNVY